MLARSLLTRSLRRRPRDIAWLAAWSLVQALPAVASGWAIAEAVSQFLAGRTADGLGWLGLLALAALAGAYGTRQTRSLPPAPSCWSPGLLTCSPTPPSPS